MILLFTAETVRQSSQGTVLGPGFPFSDSRPEIEKIIQGISIKLIFPDGSEHLTKLVIYGISVVKKEDKFYLPEDPCVELTVDLIDVPVGTQVWLP